MSLRQSVDQQRITEFLRQLGETSRVAGRVYLVGGATVVFEGYRSRTLDIDLTVETSPADEERLVRVLRDLKDRLSVNVELVSPADFIPLPGGWRERSEFVGRYGGLDVFHFDLYSTALSKIERGTEQDYADVLALLNGGRIAWAALRQCFDEIMPHYGRRSLKQDPADFTAKFRALEKKWRAAGGTL
jgi:predicted nucleotidyltransferase